LLVRDYRGKDADRLVTCIDHGAVSLVADLRAHERQAAEEPGQRKTHDEEPKTLDASPAAGRWSPRRARHSGTGARNQPR
jgi:hypothetical protein